MSTMTDVMKAEALQEYVSTVWGNPTLEVNKTIIPKKLTHNFPTRGAYNFTGQTLKLPEDGLFNVYSLGEAFTGVLAKLSATMGVWVKVTEFCADNDFILRMGYLNSIDLPVIHRSYLIFVKSYGVILITPADEAGYKHELHLTIRSSRLVHTHSAGVKAHVFKNQSERDALATAIANDPDAGFKEYLVDNRWVDVPTHAEINASTAVTVVDDTSVGMNVDIPYQSLERYKVDGKFYFLLHYPDLPKDLMLNINDIQVILLNGRFGYNVHTLAYDGTIAQLTANSCGLSTEVAESVMESLKWVPDQTTLRLRLSTEAANHLKGNFNYQAVTMQMTDDQQYRALMGLDNPPEALTAINLHTSPRNKYLNAPYDLVKENIESIYGIGEIDRIFNLGVRPGHRVDNNLLNLVNTKQRVAKAYVNGKVQANYPPSLSDSMTSLWMEHEARSEFISETVAVSDIDHPVAYKQSGGFAVEGVDYRIANEAYEPLGLVWFVAMASGRAEYVEVNNEALYVPVDYKQHLVCSNMHLFHNNVYLHPNVDYHVGEKGISLWKAVPQSRLEFKSEPRFVECVVEQGFIRNGVLSVNTSKLIEDPDNYVIFIGDKLYRSNEVSWEEDYQVSGAVYQNGLPYTILKRLMNSHVSKHRDLEKWRREHQERLAKISEYANLVPPEPIEDPTLYNKRYKLLSPFLARLVRDMANGSINFSPEYVAAYGVKATVGPERLAMLENDGDPLSVEWGTQMIEIAPHIEDTPQPMTTRGFTFLTQVSREILDNRVDFRNYYRIVS